MSPDFDELDRLSTADLHHRAVKLAEQRRDVKFFWRLLEYIPEAEVAAGDIGRADYDIESFPGLMRDFVRRGGKLDDALRPVYIDYLERGPGS
jgi:hypothetical protein